MIEKVKKIIGVAAGKGGVGKSTVSVGLALAFKQMGFSVGILDADVYGPSLNRMLTPESLPKKGERGIIPAQAGGIFCVSMSFFNAQANIVRAPIANQIIHQFIKEVEWDELDFLIVDFPPGTGDVQLSLLQEANFFGMVIVTTPQQVSLIDVQKTIEMIEKAAVPIFGVVENMSYFEEEGKRHYLFGQKGGEYLSENYHLPLLASIPIDPGLCACADAGVSLFEAGIKSAPLFLDLAQKIIAHSADLDVATYVLKDTLKIDWKDGFTYVYEGAQIQKCCPCVLCRARVDKNVDEKVEVKEVISIGQYAIKIKFSSGCSSGIYPFTMLRKLCLV